jgi:hypothetical protein
MSSREVVCRYRLRAVATLAVGAVLLAPAAASAKAPASQPAFDAFVQAWSTTTETVPAETAAPATVPAETSAPPQAETESPATAPEKATQPASRESRQAVPPGETQESMLSQAAPILLAVLGVAVVLLGLAAMPPARRRASALTVLVAERRLEIGLIGGTALASAAIGLLVAATAG